MRTRNYVQKFYNMRTQLQAVGLRIQVLDAGSIVYLHVKDNEIHTSNGGRNERVYKGTIITPFACNTKTGNDDDEQANEPPSNAKNYDGVRTTKREDGMRKIMRSHLK